MQPVLFHLGLHKTATSSLQEDFFTHENGFLQNGEKSWLLPTFVNKFCSEPTSSEELNEIGRFMLDAKSKNLTPVISHERLSGYPYSGGYDRQSILYRIRGTELNPKLLLVIREQKAWLYSAWKQTITDTGAISLKNFVNEAPLENHSRMPGVRLEYLNYARAVTDLFSMFGKENVCVVPMEMLMSDFQQFKYRLSSCIGMDIGEMQSSVLTRRNESLKLSDLYLRYYINRWLVGSPTSPKGFIPERYRIAKAIRYIAYHGSQRFLPEIPFKQKLVLHHKNIIDDAVGEFFNESNQKTSELLDIDLTKYGYCI